MLYVLNVSETDPALHQEGTATPRHPTASPTTASYLTPHPDPGTRSTRVNAPGLTEQEIFGKQPPIPDEWKLTLLHKQPGRAPTCAGSRQKLFTQNDLHISVLGYYIPQNTSFCVARTFRFCVNLNCISTKPLGSNLDVPPSCVLTDSNCHLTQEHITQAINADIPLQ